MNYDCCCYSNNTNSTLFYLIAQNFRWKQIVLFIRLSFALIFFREFCKSLRCIQNWKWKLFFVSFRFLLWMYGFVDRLKLNSFIIIHSRCRAYYKDSHSDRSFKQQINIHSYYCYRFRQMAPKLRTSQLQIYKFFRLIKTPNISFSFFFFLFFNDYRHIWEDRIHTYLYTYIPKRHKQFSTSTHKKNDIISFS